MSGARLHDGLHMTGYSNSKHAEAHGRALDVQNQDQQAKSISPEAVTTLLAFPLNGVDCILHLQH